MFDASVGLVIKRVKSINWGTYTSVETIQSKSASMNSGFTVCSEPSQILTSRGSHRMAWGLVSWGGAAVFWIANWRSGVDMSRPTIYVGWRLPMSSFGGGDEDSGRIVGGGGDSHGEGWARTVSNSPSPHPMSRIWKIRCEYIYY